MAGNTVRIKAVLDDKVSGGLAKIRDNFDRLGKNKGAASILQGVGLGVGVSAWGLLDKAVSGAVDVMGDAVKAAMADEASQSRLAAALQANVPHWNGNAAAIEKVLASRIRLGFADDDQRDSLARLVVATKNENKALEVQRVAMDLARLKGIDLGTASDALIKVEGGQFRALKALGIQLPKNATATQALQAVEKAAAGQAEAYAKTNEGKLLTSQVRVGEAMEKLGYVLLPAVGDAMVAGATAAETLVTDLEGLGRAMQTTTIFGENLNRWGEGFVNVVGTIVNSLSGGIIPAMQDVVDKAHAMDVATNRDADRIAAALGSSGVSGSFTAMADVAETETKSAADFFKDMVDNLVGEAERAISAAFDPTIEQYKLMGLVAAESAAERAAAAKGAGLAERAALAQAREDEANQLLSMAKAGATTSAAYRKGIADLKENIKTSSGVAKVALQQVLDKILAVERAGKRVPINIQVYGANGVLLNVPIGTKAGGGPVGANKPYIVGEQGPELFVPTSGGTIIPNGSSGGGRGATIINFNSIWPPTKEQARDIARVLDEAQYSSVTSAAAFNGRV